MAAEIQVNPAAYRSGVDAPPAEAVTDLGEICDWLGTYRERLRVARGEDRQEMAGHVARWTVRYQQRRSELA
jgi:hypothetical protein